MAVNWFASPQAVLSKRPGFVIVRSELHIENGDNPSHVSLPRSWHKTAFREHMNVWFLDLSETCSSPGPGDYLMGGVGRISDI